ncbi:MAG: hypothetical protein LBC26_03015, partial [Oscillospiraceae bacterium]|nr:hypothetical protein [Oscillospiraceae bacterium]
MMWTQIKDELGKVCGRGSFVLALCVLLGLTGALRYAGAPSPYADRAAYVSAYEQIDSLPAPARGAYIRTAHRQAQEAGDVWNNMLWGEFAAELDAIDGYPRYLDDIRARAEDSTQISIFSEDDPFIRRSVQKTAEAFRPLTGRVLSFVNSRTFREATDFPATDVTVVMLLLYMVMTLVVFEKEKGLFVLIKPLREGRSGFIRAKIGALALASALLTALFWGGQFWVAALKYGPVRLDACLQSVSGYLGSA